MSLTFPGLSTVKTGTQPADLNTLINNMATWADTARAITGAGAPTYKSYNTTKAYFTFLTRQNDKFDATTATEFANDPEATRFKDIRKYMIVFSNVILHQFFGIKIGARKRDYQTICNYDGTNTDLINLVKDWAEEIDPQSSSTLTEFYVDIEGNKYPLAFYSSTSPMRIFPYNTIKPFIRSHLIGWDETAQDFTMEKLLRDLQGCPTSDRALYAALKAPEENLTACNVLQTLARWVQANCNDVVTNAGTPYDMNYDTIPIDNTNQIISTIPVPKPPISPETPLFSQQLLIVGSNINVKNQEYGFCQIDNSSIGLHGDTSIHAVVPPLSPELIRMISGKSTKHDIEFRGCTVQKNNRGYEVTLTLSINGALSHPKHNYYQADVKKCDNFPLISILKIGGGGGNLQACLYRTDYPPKTEVGGTMLDGTEIRFGISRQTGEDQFALQFSQPATISDTFCYFDISYHDATEGRAYGLGYLLFSKKGENSWFSRASSAASQTMIIDEENKIAKIANYDITASNPVTCHDVFNDRLLLIDTNSRDDLDHTKNHCWGKLNDTIFLINNRYILAPFSQEFAKMVTDGVVVIQQANLQPQGDDYEFSLSFMFGGKIMVTAPHAYTKKMQYLMPNPPFFRVVEDYDARGGRNGFDVVIMPNMGLSKDILAECGNYNPVNSNDLIFKIGDRVLDNLLFVEDMNDPNQDVHIEIYKSTASGELYFGQLNLLINQFKAAPNFYPLMDKRTNCHAILLIKDQGASRPKQIITGRVFDDNLFLIAKEPSRETYEEYKAWRSFGLMVDIPNMTDEEKGDNEYQAVFPFSLNLLRNLTGNTLSCVERSATVTYDSKAKVYKVSVQINTGKDGTAQRFERTYSPNEVIKCENLPFILSFTSGNSHNWIARFNNDHAGVIRNHADGSGMIVEYIQSGNDGITRTRVEADEKMIPISSQTVILRLSTTRDNKQCSCHLVYMADKSFTDGVWAVRSELTGTQHVINFESSVPKIEEMRVFTDYIMWSSLYTTQDDYIFANGTKATGGPVEPRIYSIPVTIQFTELMVRRGLSIPSYTANVEFYNDGSDSTKVRSDEEPLNVRISLTGLQGVSTLSKRYDCSHIVAFENVPLPTLTVFPYVNFVAGNGFDDAVKGQPIWNHYIYAKILSKSDDAPENQVDNNRDYPIGSRVDFYVNGNRMNFNSRSTKIMEATPDSEQMKIANVDGWSTYIHMVYDGSSRVAPATRIDHELDNQELGCIIMDKAQEQTVNRQMKAIVGVDFGTRNSIIAILPPAMDAPYFPYHGSRELQQVIIPGMNIAENFTRFTNLSYIPHFESSMGAGCGKFASTIMTYSLAIDPTQTVNPYDMGFVPNIEGDVLERIMEGMNRPGSMGTLLGFYSDLKVSTAEDDDNGKAMMDRNVRTFIKSIMFHTVLNCYQEGCAEIDIRFSVPSHAYVEHMGSVWRDAEKYIREFIPDSMADMRNLINVKFYATEANALFQYLKQELSAKGMVMPTYSAIADGGDGTYDFTINKYENGVLTNPAAFSLRYAGQEIMTDSVNAFYEHLCSKYDNNRHNILKVFGEMWKVGRNSKGTDKKQTLEMLMNRFAEYKASGEGDRQTEKTLILMLVEQFGIDCQNLSAMQVTPKGRRLEIKPQYVNFVRMIQYKFLFLFNVLGEQIRANNVDLDKRTGNSFNIYLYGGTSQALTIAEPYCQGRIKVFEERADKLPMAQFIDAMLDFPTNVNGNRIHLKFFPAKDSEKTEIVSGLVTMKDGLIGLDSHVETSVFPDSDIPLDTDEPASGGSDDFDMSFGFGMDDAPAPKKEPVPGNVGTRERYYPKNVDELINQITEILHNRRVKLPNGEYNIDRFVIFLDEDNKPIKLSEILQRDFVKSQLDGSLDTMWSAVCSQNEDIAKMAEHDLGSAKLLHQIYLLKMVSLAIETFLR